MGLGHGNDPPMIACLLAKLTCNWHMAGRESLEKVQAGILGGGAFFMFNLFSVMGGSWVPSRSFKFSVCACMFLLEEAVCMLSFTSNNNNRGASALYISQC